MSRFPSCFPEDFESRILPDDVEFEAYTVYRVLLSGILNREAFKSSYESDPKRFKNEKKLSNPGSYSTSCFSNYDEVKNKTEFTFRKKHPKATIAKGTTEPSCGPCRKSKKQESSHIDWWIYEDANPEKYFKEIG